MLEVESMLAKEYLHKRRADNVMSMWSSLDCVMHAIEADQSSSIMCKWVREISFQKTRIVNPGKLTIKSFNISVQ
jgi:hypothetical protein